MRHRQRDALGPAGSQHAAPPLAPQAEEERKRQLEEQRREAARLVLAGKSVLVPWGTPDPFGGMAPQVGRTALAAGKGGPWRGLCARCSAAAQVQHLCMPAL